MSQQEKLNQRIELLVADLFASHSDKNLKIDSISSSFVIMYQFKGNAKFMQNMLCPTPYEVKHKIHKLKTIVDSNLVNEIAPSEDEQQNIVKLQDLNKNKIKKHYSMAIIDPKKIDKGYKNTLTRKAILDSKIESKDELIKLYECIKQDKCTKLIQTNNTISCKLGNFSQGAEAIKANLLEIMQFLNTKNIIIKSISLLLHQQDKIKASVHKIK